LALEAGRDWLAAQGAKAGFSLNRIDVSAYRTEKIPRHHQKPIELGVLDLEGDILAARRGRRKCSGCRTPQASIITAVAHQFCGNRLARRIDLRQD
jgi:hypothetical protein